MTSVIFFTFCAMIGAGVATTIARIGKPAKPVTHSAALVTLFVGVLELVALAHLYVH